EPWHIAHWLKKISSARLGVGCCTSLPCDGRFLGPDSWVRSAPEEGGGGVSPLPQATSSTQATTNRIPEHYHSNGCLRVHWRVTPEGPIRTSTSNRLVSPSQSI